MQSSDLTQAGFHNSYQFCKTYIKAVGKKTQRLPLINDLLFYLLLSFWISFSSLPSLTQLTLLFHPSPSQGTTASQASKDMTHFVTFPTLLVFSLLQIVSFNFLGGTIKSFSDGQDSATIKTVPTVLIDGNQCNSNKTQGPLLGFFLVNIGLDVSTNTFFFNLAANSLTFLY